MARKKAGIGELIKSDMSRRTIGENVAPLEFPDGPDRKEPQAARPGAEGVAGERASGQGPAAGTAPEANRPASRPGRPPKTGESGKSAPLFEYIAAEVEPEGIMDDQERQNFYDFMLGQAMRYMRGFNAGKRFHQG
jgi:hypothetical protein